MEHDVQRRFTPTCCMDDPLDAHTVQQIAPECMSHVCCATVFVYASIPGDTPECFNLDYNCYCCFHVATAELLKLLLSRLLLTCHCAHLMQRWRSPVGDGTRQFSTLCFVCPANENLKRSTPVSLPMQLITQCAWGQEQRQQQQKATAKQAAARGQQQQQQQQSQQQKQKQKQKQQ